jgi:hypothetical protein
VTHAIVRALLALGPVVVQAGGFVTNPWQWFAMTIASAALAARRQLRRLSIASDDAGPTVRIRLQRCNGIFLIVPAGVNNRPWSERAAWIRLSAALRGCRASRRRCQ